MSGEHAETTPPRVALVTATGAWETDDDAEPLVDVFLHGVRAS